MNSDNSYPIIVLAESEKFKNAAGEICEVEVRGERSFDKCYFKVKDIGCVFGNKRLEHDVTKKTSRYVEGKHYISCLGEFTPSKTGDAMRFFTYIGLTKWLMSSQDVATENYCNWMMKTLFTVQFGKKEDKKELCAKMEGMNTTEYKLAVSKCLNQTSCVYLFNIGKVKDLRKAGWEIEGSDNSCVYKYGRTKRLSERFAEHVKTYGKQTKLVFYGNVNYSQQAACEKQISDYVEDFKIKHDGHKELIVLNKGEKESLKQFYEDILTEYEDEVATYKKRLTSVKKAACAMIMDM
jgi:hypothetical protein